MCRWIIANCSFTSCIELEKETRKIGLMAMVVASLAALYANLLAGIEEWRRIH